MIIPLATCLVTLFVVSIVLAFLMNDEFFTPPAPTSSTTTTTTSTMATTTTTTTTSAALCDDPALTWSTDEALRDTSGGQTQCFNCLSLIEIDGEPFIFYARYSSLSLRVMRRPVDTWIETLIDASVETQYVTAANVNGSAGVAYHHSTAVTLHYAEYNGTAWELESLGAGGYGATMVVTADGLPHIAHVAGDLSVHIHSRDASRVWSLGPVVYTTKTFIISVTMAIVDSQLALLVHDLSAFNPTGAIYYSRFDGAAWNESTVESFNSFIPGGLALADLNGLPVMAFVDTEGTDALRYGARAANGIWTVEARPPSSGTVTVNDPMIRSICGLVHLSYCTTAICELAVLDGTWSVDTSYDGPATPLIGKTGLFDAGGFPRMAFSSGPTTSNTSYEYASKG